MKNIILVLINSCPPYPILSNLNCIENFINDKKCINFTNAM